MWKLIPVMALVLPLAAQQRPELNDGEMHGDPPILLEGGWTQLLNGNDLSGWHGLGSSQNDWFTTTSILWDRPLGPARLTAVPGPLPGGRIRYRPDGTPTN